MNCVSHAIVVYIRVIKCSIKMTISVIRVQQWSPIEKNFEKRRCRIVVVVLGTAKRKVAS